MTSEQYGYSFGVFLPFIVCVVLLVTGMTKGWSGGVLTFWLLATLFTFGLALKHVSL